MNRRLCLAMTFALAAAAAFMQPAAQAFPEPAIVSDSWQLDFEHGQPQAIAVTALDGDTHWYWYLPYKVTNHTGEDRLFIPEFTIYTDAGDLLTAGRGVPAYVFAAVQKQIGNDLLESPVQVVGQLLRGDDYAKQSVAIWPALGHDVDEVTLFIGGLSGETQTIHNPLTGDRVLVRRTLMLNYRTPGNYPTPENQPVIFAGDREVMR